MSAVQPDSGRDLLILADRIHTCSATGTVEALLVRHGRVVAAGPAADVRSCVRDHASTLDLRGTTLTPGLTDAHVHLTEWAFARREVDLSRAESPEHAAALVAEAAPADTDWIRGRGWNPHRWAHAPTRQTLDALVPDRPVALQSHDMHSLWVNSAALDLAGVDAGTADPEGGTIVRTSTGEPTGLLLEWAAQLVTTRIPAPTLREAENAVCEAQEELHSLGITGVHSFPPIHLLEPDAGLVVERLHAAGRLQVRVLQHLALPALDAAIARKVRSGAGDEWLRVGSLKMFLDGALGSRTAWMRAPYEDASGHGMQVLNEVEFRHHVRRAAAHGIAATVHAIGDAAVSLALDVLSDPASRVPAMPHRIEHLQCCPVDRFGAAAEAGIVCSMQPSHLITDWRIAERCWGVERSRGAFALRSLLDHGTTLAFGSDVPVEPVDPRRGLYAAVTRQDLEEEPPDGWFPGERIAARDALCGYTVGPARAAGLAEPAGSLGPGAPADVVAWDRDPLGPPDALMNMRCVAAFVGGMQLYTG
jgi:predicted amidohydrolase YtcJ